MGLTSPLEKFNIFRFFFFVCLFFCNAKVANTGLYSIKKIYQLLLAGKNRDNFTISFYSSEEKLTDSIKWQILGLN